MIIHSSYCLGKWLRFQVFTGVEEGLCINNGSWLAFVFKEQSLRQMVMKGWRTLLNFCLQVVIMKSILLAVLKAGWNQLVVWLSEQLICFTDKYQCKIFSKIYVLYNLSSVSSAYIQLSADFFFPEKNWNFQYSFLLPLFWEIHLTIAVVITVLFS